ASTPANTLVTQAMVTAGTWVYVDTAISTGNPATPIEFALLPGMYYQLIETVPPAGFQMPMGQWRIRSVERVVGGVTQTGFRVETISEGVSVPGFVNILTGGVGNTFNTTYGAYFGGTFYLGNMVMFELPLTGGSGSTVVFITGSIFIGMVMIAAFIYVVLKKRMRVAVNKSRYSRLV
ncbi:MAG: hypothetical protein FWC92_11115, partial [Defluviitaleaceae bacterium]|nr:hypothetical protein [Defluviitaleaceae bacterium]